MATQVAPRALSKIAPPDKLVVAKLARWGMYGVNGAGKTSFLATIPPELPTLVVSADQENVKPLRGLSHVAVYKLEEWKQLDDILELLQHPRCPFKVCAWDTWTRVQGLAANFIAGYKLVDPGKEHEYIERAPRLPKGFEQWQQIGALVVEWMRYFNRTPVHQIYLMQEIDRHPKYEDDILVTEPALTPSAVHGTKEVLEILGRLYVDTSKEGVVVGDESHRAIDPNATERRMLLLGKHPRYFAKGDTRRLGYVVEDPTWDKLSQVLV